MSILQSQVNKFIWKIKDKFDGRTHSHARENARRRKQIGKLQLTKSNGLVV